MVSNKNKNNANSGLKLNFSAPVFFGKAGCKLNIFFVTFNLALAILAYGLSISKPVTYFL